MKDLALTVSLAFIVVAFVVANSPTLSVAMGIIALVFAVYWHGMHIADAIRQNLN